MNEMERSQKKDWVLTDKEEIILSFVTLLLQGILQKPKVGSYFSHNKLLATSTLLLLLQQTVFSRNLQSENCV
jgi:hypothetical protein